ncbi:putative talin 2 [Schistosoma mansoni]|uniref:putative talin 2 n=1 Tax=Schistosoma mansoni TaxID=6183 RepID=UPI00022DC1E8|nr:putative talin 2 [Schistosoma mansoni]|eukprot:XP_018648608.1 putative talin 2 [Schistosoma mansoni]
MLLCFCNRNTYRFILIVVRSMLGDSRSLVLRVHLPKAGITKTTAFDAQMTVGQACERIRAQVRESDQTDGAKDYGLFLPHEDNKKGLWLDNSRTLEHYILRNGDTIEYRYRYRWLYIRTMDGTRKTLKVDDSKTVAELMLMICTKMGIYNYEEYLLARDRDETDRERTNTLKRSTGHHHHTGTLMRDQEKMEKLKRKLHTDDDMEWLNPSQSLRQQGVDEKEILLLKRRYFFSDMNVDARDPVQLNLLYVQLKDAILKGTHPVSLEEAVYLAGIQCQVQFGNYVAEKFKPNFLDLKDFLPKEYAKIRSLEKKIFQQHAELCGLSEIEAKVKYCQFCRSLKTYGITFFLVKERIKGKNKLIPRLLGITKDSVVRLDEKTKEVLKIWPLTSICKWAASPHAFTMDFGEYSPDEYYTAQTSEGEQISQLIAGYIDIILKKQKATDHPGLQGDEESAMYEENVQAERATIVQHQRVPVRVRGKDQLVNGVVEKPFDHHQHRNDLASHQIHTNGVWSIHQQNNLVGDENSTVIDGQSILTATTTRQMSPDNFMTGGTHIFHYQEMSPAQKSLLITINEDLETLQAAKEHLDIGPPTERHLLNVGTDEASKRWLSESMGASQAKVTDEVGAMNAAVAQALRSANRAESTDINAVQQGQPLDQIHDPGDDLMMMQQSFRVVTIHFPAFVDDLKRVAVLRRESGALKADQTGQPIIAEKTEESTQNLLSAARHVADAFTDLLQSARPLAMGQDQLLGLAKAVANATAGLVVKAKVLASQITSDPEAQQRVIASVTQTGLCTSQLVACTKVLAPTIHQPTCQQQLSEAGREVTWAVDGVVQASRAAVHVPSEDPQMVQQSIIETETAATEVRDALDQLNAHLLKGSYKGYQGDALNSFQTSYEDLKQYYTTDGQRMVASARRLAQATALMIADIKAQAEESGDDSDRQNRLFHAAKQLADATTNLINAAKACSSNPDNIQLQTELRDAADELYTLAYSAGGEQFQTRLIHNLQSAARATVTGATQLVNISQAATKYSRGNSYQLHNDTRNVTNLIPKTVITIRESRANPDDPMALLELIGACERFVQPCTAMVRSSKSLAPTLSDPSIQAALENSNSQLASALETLITCLIKVAPFARHLQLDGALTRLTRLSDEVAEIETSLMQGTLTPIPEQKVEDCCHLVNISVHDGTESAKKLDSIINSMAKMDSAVLNQLGISSNSNNNTSAAESPRRAGIQNIRQAVQLSYELVRAVKDTRIACDAKHPANAATVQSHSQQLTTQLIETLTRCLRGLPGHREISEATYLIEQKRSQLIQYSQPNQINLTARFVEPNEYQRKQTDLTQAAVEFNQHSYYDCVDTVAKSLEPLAESLRTMSTSARDQKLNEFSFAVRQCANSVCQLVEETAQTAYLIGLADRIENRRVSGATSISSGISSPPGSSLIDLDLFIQSQKEIQSACNAICEPNVNNRQVISLSTEMARSAKTLCEACSQLASQTTNVDTRQRLNNITKQTMQSITSLIQHRGSTVATDVNGEWSESNRQQTLANAQAVSANVANLVKLITTEPRLVDLTTSQERITNTTKETQRPVCVAGLESLNATQTVLRAAQNLLSTSRMGPSENTFMAFSSASKDLSNSIKVLANAMRENAPGQRECQCVFNNIKKLLHELQDARIASMENRLPPRRELNEEGFQRQVATSVRALLDSAPAVGRAASSEAEQLGRTILTWDFYLPGLVSGSIAAASRSPLSSTQLVYLDHACTVLEAASQLVTVAKDSGGNPRAVHLHDSLNESVRGLVDSCEEFLTILDDVASRQGHVSTLIDTLNRAQAQAEEIIQVPMDARFSDYQTRMLRIARHMDQLNQAIQLRARQPASDGEIAPLAHNLTQEYQEMCQTCKGAAATLPDVNQADQLRSAVRGVGTACISLIQATSASRPDIYGSGTTTGGQHLLLTRNKSIVELDRRAEFLDSKLRNLINLLEIHGPGTQACLQSASTVSGIISDLDTTILFASSGTLHPPVRDDFDAIWTDNEFGHSRLTADRGHSLALSNNTDGTSIPSRAGSRSEMHNVENFTPLRESIARTARALVDDTQSLVSGTGEDQARLANTAHIAVERITELADVVKRGAAVIGPGQPDTQLSVVCQHCV